MTLRERSIPLYVLALGFILAAMASPLQADPCLVVYQNGYVEYHYDTNEYYTVTPGHPLYDPAYDRGGEVLLEVGTNMIDHTIYQAPNLTAFKMSTNGQEGYFSIGSDFDLVVDGFNNIPTFYTNILLVFEPNPGSCSPIITIDGSPALFDPQLGWYFPIGDLNAVTPTPDGNNYSDTREFYIEWQACSGMRVWAFADEDFNLMNDGGECFTAFSHDLTVPVEETTWGAIKKLYND
jgi:hypothetical protein